MILNIEDIKNNIIHIYYQIHNAFELVEFDNDYPIVIWLSDDHYCIYNHHHAFNIPREFKISYLNLYLFDKHDNVTICHASNNNNNKIYYPLQFKKQLYFKLFDGAGDYKNDFMFYSLTSSKTEQHKLYVKDLLLLLSSMFEILMCECDTYKSGYIKDILLCNAGENLYLQILPETSNDWFIDIKIYNRNINEKYVVYAENEIDKLKNKFTLLIKHILYKLDSVLDQDVKTNIKMFNDYYSIDNHEFLFKGIRYLDKKEYFLYKE